MAQGVLLPYMVLSIIFEYPDMLCQDAALVLTKFHEGGSRLIWIWFYAISGLPLLIAIILPFRQQDNFLKGITANPSVRFRPTVSSSFEDDQFTYIIKNTDRPEVLDPL